MRSAGDRDRNAAHLRDSDPLERRRSRGWLETPRKAVVFYTAAFVVTEAIGAFVSLELQAVLGGLLAVLSLNFAIFGYRNQRTTGMVMAVLFSVRLFTIVVPFVDISLPARTAIVGLATVFAIYLASWVLSNDVMSTRAREGLPLKKPIVSAQFTTALVALSGIPIGFAAHELLQPDPLVMRPLLGLTALAWAVACLWLIVGALGEELLYRRLVTAMVQHTAMSQTPWISAILFAATYLGTRNAGFILLVFLTGAWFMWSCERTGRIRGPVIAHAIANLLVFVILPN